MEADVVKLVDTLVLGTSAVRCEGSSPFIRTNKKSSVAMQPGFFVFNPTQACLVEGKTKKPRAREARLTFTLECTTTKVRHTCVAWATILSQRVYQRKLVSKLILLHPRELP